MFHGVRYSLLYRKVKRKYDDEMPRALDYILAKGQLGDWFVLYQLSKNSNTYFFRYLLKLMDASFTSQACECGMNSFEMYI